MQIRIATPQDKEAVGGIYWSAFAVEEREAVARLAMDLLGEATTPPTIALLAEVDGVAAGHVAYSPVGIEGSRDFQGYLLAPLAVRPDFQKRGIGSRLVESGRQRLAEMGAGILFVYGDPRYYGRFGFRVETAAGYVPPYALRFPFGWQGLVLRDSGGNGPGGRLTCVVSLQDPVLW